MRGKELRQTRTMGFTYSNALRSKTYSAGATRPRLTLELPEGDLQTSWRVPGFNEAYWTSFGPGAATLAVRGKESLIRVTPGGQGRIALIARAWAFKQIEGHSPKVWKESSSKCEGGILLVAQEGYEFEARNYKRAWRRFRLTTDGPVEVDQASEAID
jgi:hypothetical protein